MNTKILSALLGATISSVEAGRDDTDPMVSLYSLNVHPDRIVVFGYSCGSWIAHQLGTIFSKTIKGQILACGGLAFDGSTSESNAYDRVDGYSTDGDIDPTSNLANYPVYIFSSASDTVIPPINQYSQDNFYNNYNANIEFVSSSTANLGHAFESDTFYNGMVNVNANIDSSQTTLSSDQTLDWQSLGTLLQFDQDEFAGTDRDTSGFADRGYFYYPNNCVGANAGCQLVIAFAGGDQNVTDIMTQGIVQTAAANDFVVLFPQQENPARPCFDVEGWSGDGYDTKTGIQSAVFESMMNRLLEAQDSTTYDYDAPTLRIRDWEAYGYIANFIYWIRNFLFGYTG